MNRPNPFAANGLFKPASHFLSSTANAASVSHRKSPSLDDSDTEYGEEEEAIKAEEIPRSAYLTPDISTEPSSVPFIDTSRSPSPFTRSASIATPDVDHFDATFAQEEEPLVAVDLRSRSSARQVLEQDGIGQFFYGTATGWKVYMGLLISIVGSSQFGIVFFDTIILKTGTYKFEYPLTMTLLQIVIAHALLLALANVTRKFELPLQNNGLGYVVAPLQAARKTRATRYQKTRHQSRWAVTLHRLTHGSGGISGGGLLEWQSQSAMRVLPVAVIFTLKIVLSNFSYTYADISVYTLSHLATVPLTLVFTTYAINTTYTVQILASSILTTLALLIASSGHNGSTGKGAVFAGIVSSVLIALYPVVLLRTYKQLVSDLIPQGSALFFREDDSSTISTGTKEETRAYWRVLHYTSTMSIALLLPLVILSGEPWQIWKNCVFLGSPGFWFLMFCAGACSWAVSAMTLLLVKATSPLTANFASLPRNALQLAVLGPAALALHNWMGICLCWAGSVWYLVARAKEGSRREYTRD